MDNEFRIVRGGRQAGQSQPARRGEKHLAALTQPRITAPPSDRVSLSRAYTAIHSSEMVLRLQNLQLQVAQNQYWVSAEDLTSCILAEHLLVA